MNKGDLVAAVAKSMSSKAEAERAVNAVLVAIQKGLKKDKKVALVGFGTFAVKVRKARTGRNPRTGETIKIKKSKTVGFKAGQALKSSI